MTPYRPATQATLTLAPEPDPPVISAEFGVRTATFPLSEAGRLVRLTLYRDGDGVPALLRIALVWPDDAPGEGEGVTLPGRAIGPLRAALDALEGG